MLLEVKCRTFNRLTRRIEIEPLLIDVPSGSGDDAAEMAHALRPNCAVVGIAPPDPEAARLHAERQGPALEGESDAPDMSQDRPSARDLAQQSAPTARDAYLASLAASAAQQTAPAPDEQPAAEEAPRRGGWPKGKKRGKAAE